MLVGENLREPIVVSASTILLVLAADGVAVLVSNITSSPDAGIPPDPPDQLDEDDHRPAELLTLFDEDAQVGPTWSTNGQYPSATAVLLVPFSANT